MEHRLVSGLVLAVVEVALHEEDGASGRASASDQNLVTSSLLIGLGGSNAEFEAVIRLDMDVSCL